MAALALLAALAAVRSPLNAGPLYGFPSGKRATTASHTSSPSAPFLTVRLDERTVLDSLSQLQGVREHGL